MMVNIQTKGNKSEMIPKGKFLEGSMVACVEEISPNVLLVGIQHQSKMVIFDLNSQSVIEKIENPNGATLFNAIYPLLGSNQFFLVKDNQGLFLFDSVSHET